MLVASEGAGWGRSGLSDRQRGVLIVVALFDLVFVFVVVLVLGGLMGLSTDACPLDRISVCDPSVDAAFRLNCAGQAVVFGGAAAVAVIARSFRVKLTALAVAPMLGTLIFLVANSTIIRR